MRKLGDLALTANQRVAKKKIRPILLTANRVLGDADAKPEPILSGENGLQA